MKTEEKTVKEWLNTLKEPYKSKALNQLNKDKEHIKVDNIVSALYNMFEWFYSDEGETYWHDLVLSLENIE